MARCYSRKHYELLSNGPPDRPGDAERRVRNREACEQAHRETIARFGAFTPENAAEAIAWQESRIRALTARAQHTLMVALPKEE